MSVMINTFSNKIRSCCHASATLCGYCSYSFFLTNPRRYRYQNCNTLCNTVFIIVIFCLTTWLVSQQNTQIKASTLSPWQTSYESKRIQIPHYLLLDIDDRSESKCKQIFQNVIPNIEQNNMKDKDFIRSLFENKISSAYITYSDMDKAIPEIRAKLCSNISYEWILFSIVEKDQLPATCTYTAATTLVLVVFILIIAIGIFLKSSSVAFYCSKLKRCVRYPTNQVTPTIPSNIQTLNVNLWNYMVPAARGVNEFNTVGSDGDIDESHTPERDGDSDGSSTVGLDGDMDESHTLASDGEMDPINLLPPYNPGSLDTMSGESAKDWLQSTSSIGSLYQNS
ncbi:unnamed protein product [Adineta steineri]|uniref:Uncharacterized protein n=1 Tax=Adineta steineri TaxID=433720 RepID=A0A814H8L8_9BILA|nr:unnamed protein product [Adineta steineri]